MGSTQAPDSSTARHFTGDKTVPDTPRFPVHPDEPPVMMPLSLAGNLLDLLGDADAAGVFGPCVEADGHPGGYGADDPHRPCKACLTMETLLWVTRAAMGPTASLENTVFGHAARLSMAHAKDGLTRDPGTPTDPDAADAADGPPPAPPGDCE